MNRWSACPGVTLVTQGLGWPAGRVPRMEGRRKQGLGLSGNRSAAPARSRLTGKTGPMVGK